MNVEIDPSSSKRLRRTASGISSMVIGALSIIAVSAVRHYETFRDPASAHLIDVLDRLGLVRQAPPGTEAELKPSGLVYPLTDESALRALLFYGVYLGIASILLAIWAEHRQEENVYLSAGFMCGACGLFLVSPFFGMIATAAGAVAVLLLRRRRLI